MEKWWTISLHRSYLHWVPWNVLASPKIKGDMSRPTDIASSRHSSPPNGNMTWVRAKSLWDKVNSLSVRVTLAHVDSMLLHSNALCLISTDITNHLHQTKAPIPGKISKNKKHWNPRTGCTAEDLGCTTPGTSLAALPTFDRYYRPGAPWVQIPSCH
jgi:hypothetical protein